ncbi:MAG: hypothetical protein KDK24_01350 [Pseudooceanicola sp.]|nr:hypothetical protein [Pseudooceanicola sp.]
MNQPVQPVGLPPPPAPETLEFSDLLDLSVKLNSRIDTLWQRVIYAHAAMVGVLVFFASAEHPFTIPRLLVVFFYSMNSAVTWVAFREAYSGLKAVAADLAVAADQKSAVYAWARSQRYDMHALRRLVMLAVMWVIISYLILAPLVEYWRAVA